MAKWLIYIGWEMEAAGIECSASLKFPQFHVELHEMLPSRCLRFHRIDHAGTGLRIE